MDIAKRFAKFGIEVNNAKTKLLYAMGEEPQKEYNVEQRPGKLESQLAVFPDVTELASSESADELSQARMGILLQVLLPNPRNVTRAIFGQTLT